jgi:hypothetical protein
MGEEKQKFMRNNSRRFWVILNEKKFDFFVTQYYMLISLKLTNFYIMEKSPYHPTQNIFLSVFGLDSSKLLRVF